MSGDGVENRDDEASEEEDCGYKGIAGFVVAGEGYEESREELEVEAQTDANTQGVGVGLDAAFRVICGLSRNCGRKERYGEEGNGYSMHGSRRRRVARRDRSR